MLRSSATLWAAISAVILATAAPASRADTRDDAAAEDPRTEAAREVFRAAVEAVQRGDWLEARELYRRSHDLWPAPATLYSLAVAQRETGELVEALDSFRAFLAMPSTAELERFREAATRASEDLDGRIVRLRIVVVPATAGDVEVRLDGNSVEQDHEQLLNPGLHTVEARADGYQPKIFSVRFASGTRERRVVELSPRETEIAGKPGGGAPAPASWEPPLVTLAALSAGSAVLSAGVTTGIVGVITASEASEPGEADRARRLALAGDVMAVTGAVGIGLGVAFWIASAAEGDEPGRTAFVVGPGSASLQIRW
jgi:hypothetical protein